MAAAFGARPAAVARELTKRFEEVRRGGFPTGRALPRRRRGGRSRWSRPRGGRSRANPAAELEPQLEALLAGGMSVKEAVASVAAATGAPRREVYARALALKRMTIASP